MTKRLLASLDNGQPYQLVISSSAFPSILTACSSIYKCQHILRAVVRYADTTSQIQKNLQLSMRVLPTDIEYYIERQLVTMAQTSFCTLYWETQWAKCTILGPGRRGHAPQKTDRYGSSPPIRTYFLSPLHPFATEALSLQEISTGKSQDYQVFECHYSSAFMFL